MRYWNRMVIAAFTSARHGGAFRFLSTTPGSKRRCRTRFAPGQSVQLSSAPRSGLTDYLGDSCSLGGELITTTASTNEFATSYHSPVMYKECIKALLGCHRALERSSAYENETSADPLIFIDGTLGGGGHSAALLQQLLPGDIVLGCDVDPMALATASTRLANYLVTATTNDGDSSDKNSHPLFIPVQSNFADLVQAVSSIIHPVTKKPITLVDGIMLDLGVSSYQFDTADRGFAFLKDGPLDMRLSGESGITAAELVNELDEEELRRILKTFGDEPRARVIAQAIVERRPLRATQDLVEAVAAVTPQFAKKGRRMGRTATLARVFQSLRIVVNQEDIMLNKGLVDMAPTLLRPGGRLAVLSYHSMEDRATKRVMRDGTVSRNGQYDERDLYGNYIGTPRPFRTLGKPMKATDEEIEQNSRARSATLRVAERENN
jgi:16S rRNA (cytosine1402-N4)-methyltransferase